MEKSLDEFKKPMVLLMCHQLISAIAIYFLLGLFVKEGTLPRNFDASLVPIFMAGVAAFLFIYLIVFFAFLLRIKEEASELGRRKDKAETWMATIGPGAFSLPRQFWMWKEDATGKRVSGSERIFFCLPAKSVSASNMSVSMNAAKPMVVSATANDSGQLRLIYTEDNIYMVVFAPPAPLAKLALSSSQPKLLPPK